MSKVFEEIYAKISEFDTIVIHRHIRPDPDALGSQGGLAALISQKFPEKSVYTVGTDVENLSFMGRMDVAESVVYENALVIVVDTANRPRIDDKRYSEGKYLIKIDHHPDEDRYGDISYVNTNASSCSEIIAEFSLYLEERLPMNAEAARLLYAGIVGDTGRFLYPATTPTTMRIAAHLMEFDFSASEMNQFMNTNTKKVANLSGFVLQNVVIDELGVAHIVLTEEVLTQFDADDSETSPVVPLPGTIEGVVCWGIFVQQPHGGYRCRLRSKGPIINEVAKRHGGGGHPLASGANAKDAAEIKEILDELRSLVRQDN